VGPPDLSEVGAPPPNPYQAIPFPAVKKTRHLGKGNPRAHNLGTEKFFV